jgi:type VI secretion system protein ImpG
VVKQPLSLGGDSPDPGAASPLAHYFAQELADFADIGKRLGNSHPHLARHLAREANNPDIERLIEGTAYLCAQVRARVDACAPQWTNELSQMMAPWVQRALPAAMVAAFEISASSANTPLHLPRGTALTGPATHTGLGFCTTEATTVLPITVVGARLEEEGPKTVRLIVSLKHVGKLTYEDLQAHGLRLFVGGNDPDASLLAMALWHQTVQAQLHDGSCFAALPGSIERPNPYAAEPLTPTFADDPPMPRGIARLRDFFALPPKDLFATFRLTEAPRKGPVGEDLALSVSLNKAWGLPSSLQNICLRLNAVPAVNLTKMDAMPVRIQPGRCRYVLRPQQEGHVLEVLAIHTAELTPQAGAAALALMPQHSYRWAQQGSHAHGLFHTFEPPASQLAPAHIQVHHAQDVPPPLTPATLSARLWCHHGAQAAQLPAGSLTLEARHPSRARAVNATGTSAAVPAPAGTAARAALLALVAQRGRSSLTASDVRRILGLLQSAHAPDSPTYRAQALVISSVVDVHTEPSVRLWRGAQVLCLDVTLELDARGFHNIAHAYLFADCLTDLWADTLPIHGVMRMHLICPKLGRSITWPLRAGQITFGQTTCTLLDERR